MKQTKRPTSFHKRCIWLGPRPAPRPDRMQTGCSYSSVWVGGATGTRNCQCWSLLEVNLLWTSWVWAFMGFGYIQTNNSWLIIIWMQYCILQWVVWIQSKLEPKKEGGKKKKIQDVKCVVVSKVMVVRQFFSWERKKKETKSSLFRLLARSVSRGLQHIVSSTTLAKQF